LTALDLFAAPSLWYSLAAVFNASVFNAAVFNAAVSTPL